MKLIGPGRDNLITDISGIKVGHATDHTLKSGVSVVTSEGSLIGGVHVMGGAPGSRETDLLAGDGLVDTVDAFVLSGGSAYGLDAAGGVMDALRESGRGFSVGAVKVPIVPAAILFDLLNGGEKKWTKNPYPALGKAAAITAKKAFDLGTVGAGTGALAGTVKGGLGSASLAFDDGTLVGALIAVNPFGSPLCPDSGKFWAAPWELASEFGGFGLARPKNPLDLPAMTDDRTKRGTSHTVIGVVATNACLTAAEARRLAIAAHDGIARAVIPSHTLYDGDLIFTAATGENPSSLGADGLMALGHAASLCVTRAIGRGVYEATPLENDMLPIASAIKR